MQNELNDNTLKFLKLVTSSDGLNIGARHISVSTCGVVDKIYTLAEENFGITPDNRDIREIKSEELPDFDILTVRGLGYKAVVVK